MKNEEIIIKISKDVNVSDAVCKALDVDRQTYQITNFSKKQENSIQDGKLFLSITEFRGVAG